MRQLHGCTGHVCRESVIEREVAHNVDKSSRKRQQQRN